MAELSYSSLSSVTSSSKQPGEETILEIPHRTYTDAELKLVTECRLDVYADALREGRLSVEEYLQTMGYKWQFAHEKSITHSWTRYRWGNRATEFLREVEFNVYHPNIDDKNIMKTILTYIPEIVSHFILTGEFRRWVVEGRLYHFQHVMKFYRDDGDRNRSREIFKAKIQVTWGMNPKFVSISSEIEACRDSPRYHEFIACYEQAAALFSSVI
jgi:hypothetical protein